jgi:hypothetical protein
MNLTIGQIQYNISFAVEYPDMIDPKRPEYAYGIWTKKAENW